jgi:hypothetical protein
MDGDGQDTDTSARVSVVRAGIVLVAFVIATAILVAVGTRPTVSGVSAATTTTVATTGTTTTAAGGATTTTTAAHTTTTAHSGHHGTGTSTTTTTVAPSSVSVVVANATSVNGLAAHYSTVIGAGGWSMKPPLDASTSEATSTVYYATGMQAPATQIATAIGVKASQVQPLTTATPVSGVTGTDVVVVIGQDLAAAG